MFRGSCDRGGARRRAAVAIYLVSGLSVVVLIMGMLSSFQVSTVLQTMERTHAYRLMDLASESAFEEAAEQLEQKVKALDFPKLDEHRDLGRQISWPTQLDVPIARRDVADQGVTISQVSIQSSPWIMFQAEAGNGSILSLERGIVQMQVDVTVRAGGTTASRRVTARRYMSLEPPLSGDKARLVVQGVNIYREFASL